MTTNDITVEILREIRDGIRSNKSDRSAGADRCSIIRRLSRGQTATGVATWIQDVREDTNARLDQTRDEIKDLREDTNARPDQTNARPDRVETGLVDLGKFMRQLALDMAKYERFHHHHVERLGSVHATLVRDRLIADAQVPPDRVGRFARWSCSVSHGVGARTFRPQVVEDTSSCP